ncbi:MAG: ABC transporter permease [Chloroflexota bacterium]
MTLGLLRVAWKNLAYRRFRTVLTILAVALGTSVVTATFATNAAIQDSMERSAQAMTGRADLLVEAVDDSGFPYDISAAALRKLTGVTLVAPQVQKRVFYRTPTQRGFVELVGVDPAIDAEVQPQTVVAGAFLSSPTAREIVVGTGWAEKTGTRLGSDVEIITGEGFQKFRVVGVLEETDPSHRGFSGLIRVPIQVAQESFGLENQANSFRIVVRDAASIGAVRQALKGAMPASFVVKESATLLSEFRSSIQDFQVALIFFGAIALLAGAYLVYTTLSLTILEQVREIGLLRAAGADVGYIMRLTVAQGVLVGVVGSLFGAVAGQALAWLLIAVLSATQDIATNSFVLSWQGIVAGITLGVLVTLFASVAPGRQAAAISPLAASNPRQTETEAKSERSRDIMALVMSLALTAFLFVPVQDASLRALKLVGVLVLLVLFSYAVRMAVPWLATIAVTPLRRIAWGVSTLAERNIHRLHARTATTGTAYLMSLSMVVALFNSWISFSTAAEERALTLFPGEYTVVSPVSQPLELITEFESIKGVDQVSPVELAPAVWQNLRITVAGLDPAHFFSAFQFQQGDRIEAFRSMRRGDGVLVPADLAADKGLKLGDKLKLSSGGRESEFVVGGVIAHSFPTATSYGAVVAPIDTLKSAFGIETWPALPKGQVADKLIAKVADALSAHPH